MTATQSPAAEGTLLFVYAADSGLFNTVSDIAHKIFSPETYACRLCALTHGHFKVRKAWQAFVDSLGVPCRFLHRDDAADLPGVDTADLPAVYRWHRDNWQLCMSRDAISSCPDLDALMAAVGSACLDTQGL